MSRNCRCAALFAIFLFVWLFVLAPCDAETAEKVGVTVNWNKVVAVSRTTPTLQVVPMPPLLRGSAIHDALWRSLRELGCDYVRYAPWPPYPFLAVAELEPPANGKTSWDFSRFDSVTEDLMKAQAGHSMMFNDNVIPSWMFKGQTAHIPDDPNKPYPYFQGGEFRDPTLKEVAGYYARMASWYTQGGFTDEYGKRHESGHHYKIDYWEVLNEVNGGQMTRETYTRVYDAIVEAVRAVDPRIKFVGLALDGTPPTSEWIEYFLNKNNHKPGIPIDMITYHFYAWTGDDETLDTQQFTFWDQAGGFLDKVEYIQRMVERLSPGTRVDLDELGTGWGASDFAHPAQAIPKAYWNLSGGTFAYLYAEVAKRGVDVAGESQLIGYPSQYPSVSMVDWKTGQPNARYWVLKMLHDNFGPGDKLVDTANDRPWYSGGVYSQGFVTHDGKRKLLLINQRKRDFSITIPGGDGAKVTLVDQSTGFDPPASRHLSGHILNLGGFAVAIVDFSK